MRILGRIRDAYRLRRLIRYYEKPIENNYRKYYAGKPGVPELTKEQEAEILAYFKEKTGRRISLLCHRYFLARNGIYAKEYLPLGLYKVFLLYRANKKGYRDAYADKNMADVYLPDVAHPEIVVKNMNGSFYMDGKAVSREEALARCQDLKECLIKPSLATHGDGVRKLEVTDGRTNIDGIGIGQLFDRYGKNWCIQKFIRQHDRMRALNPTSVNTVRVLTYRSGMEVLVLYAVARIGRSGREIDNQTAGGISAKIDENGCICRYGYGSVGVDKVEYTDSGIRLEGYQIPSFPAILDTVKRLHPCLPFFNLVGWDMAVREDGVPVLVEWNACTELSQLAAGPGFGAYTDRILTELYKRPNDLNPRW